MASRSSSFRVSRVMRGVRLGTWATRRTGEVRTRGVEGDRRRASDERVGGARADVEAAGRIGNAETQTGLGASWVAIRLDGERWAEAGRAILERGATASVVR